VTVLLPTVSVALCIERLERVFPRAAFDAVMSSPLAAASVAAMIYLGAVRDNAEAAEQRYVRPSMVMWLNDSALAHAKDIEREAWYRSALVSKKKVAELEQSWGLTFAQRYADNTRETLRDETFPKWREQGAMEQRPGLPTASSAPRWMLARHFADLFDPALEGDALTRAVDDWTQTHMSTAGRMRAMSARRLENSGHLIDVVLSDGSHRQLEPGVASSILKGVIEEWAPRKLKSPLVLSISEPGDKVYLADAKLLASVGIQIDMSAVLPDALILDGEAEPLQFWIVEAPEGEVVGVGCGAGHSRWELPLPDRIYITQRGAGSASSERPCEWNTGVVPGGTRVRTHVVRNRGGREPEARARDPNR
jgi:hypothetical protein